MLDDIKETLELFRPLLERRIESLFGGQRPGDNTDGCCRGASGALLKVLRHRHPEVSWHFCGGLGDESQLSPGAEEYINVANFPGGFAGPEDDLWFGHFWVEGQLPDGRRIIVDTTADQFGDEKTLVTSAADSRYRGNLMPQHDVSVWVVSPATYFVDGLYADWQYEIDYKSQLKTAI
jgi:hypothetical protein